MRYDDDMVPGRICADCGTGYALTVGEVRFFEAQQIPLPKRCASCRARKRALNAQRGERPAGTVYSPSWRPGGAR